MLSLRIAFRFLRKSPVQSLLIMGGIMVGIAVQIFVGSLITSLQASLLDTTVGSSPHITLQAQKNGDPVTYDAGKRAIVEADPRVKAVASVVSINGVYTNGSDSAPLNLIGGNLRELNGIYKLDKRLVAGRPSLQGNETLVGKEFATKYGLGPGDSMIVRLPEGGTVNLRISGVYDIGSAAFNERTAFVPLQLAASKLGYSGDQYSAVQIQLFDPFKSAAVASQWRSQAVFGGAEVVDWQEQNKQLLVGLQSQSSSSYMIQFFVLLAVALGIASTLAISAVQKTRQIGILKAMGMGDAASGQIFLWSALLLGVGGTVLGVGLGIGLIQLFMLGPATFTITPQPLFVAGSAAVGIGVAMLSSIIPSRRTSKLDPIEVIQGG